MRIILISVFILFFHFNFAQESNWIEAGENIFVKTNYENSNKPLVEFDFIRIETYLFNTLQDDYVLEEADDVFNEQIPFGDYSSYFKKPFFKKSEYLIRFEYPIPPTYNYRVFLLDNIGKQQLEDMKQFLVQNFTIQEIEYISKKEAARIAKDELGVDINQFGSNPFPASLELKANEPINTQIITEKFIDDIDEILDLNTRAIILKIIT